MHDYGTLSRQAAALKEARHINWNQNRAWDLGEPARLAIFWGV